MIHDGDPMEPLIGTNGPFRTSVRTFNLLYREGVRTVEAFLKLGANEVYDWRNAGLQTWAEIASVQYEIRKLRERPGPSKGPDESQTAFTIRVLSWTAWWEGHDAGCSRECGWHHNPYEKPEEST